MNRPSGFVEQWNCGMPWPTRLCSLQPPCSRRVAWAAPIMRGPIFRRCMFIKIRRRGGDFTISLACFRWCRPVWRRYGRALLRPASRSAGRRGSAKVTRESRDTNLYSHLESFSVMQKYPYPSSMREVMLCFCHSQTTHASADLQVRLTRAACDNRHKQKIYACVL